MIANRVVNFGVSPAQFKTFVIGLGIFVLILFAGPLTIFLYRLRAAKRQGIFEYGALASDVGRQFEQKWLNRIGGIDESAMDVPDFSSTVDLDGLVANVYQMKEVPFGWKDLVFLIAAALLPFLPIALMAVPFKVLLEHAAKLLL